MAFSNEKLGLVFLQKTMLKSIACIKYFCVGKRPIIQMIKR